MRNGLHAVTIHRPDRIIPPLTFAQIQEIELFKNRRDWSLASNLDLMDVISTTLF